MTDKEVLDLIIKNTNTTEQEIAYLSDKAKKQMIEGYKKVIALGAKTPDVLRDMMYFTQMLTGNFFYNIGYGAHAHNSRKAFNKEAKFETIITTDPETGITSETSKRTKPFQELTPDEIKKYMSIHKDKTIKETMSFASSDILDYPTSFPKETFDIAEDVIPNMFDNALHVLEEQKNLFNKGQFGDNIDFLNEMYANPIENPSFDKTKPVQYNIDNGSLSIAANTTPQQYQKSIDDRVKKFTKLEKAGDTFEADRVRYTETVASDSIKDLEEGFKIQDNLETSAADEIDGVGLTDEDLNLSTENDNYLLDETDPRNKEKFGEIVSNIDEPLDQNVIDFREKQLEKIIKEVEDATPDVTKITSSQAEMIDNALADAAANLRRGTFESIPGGKGALTKAIKTRLFSILGDGLNLLDVYELGLLLGAVGQPALDPIVKIIFPDVPDDNRPYKERVLENIQRVEKISPTAKAVKKIAPYFPEPVDREYTIYGVPSNRAVQFTSMYGMLGGNNE